MLESVRTFLSEIVDYAGLFPPAELPIDAAIRNYAAYRRQPEAWMLGRFICPAAWLTALAPFRDELFAQSPPFRFSILGRGGETSQQFAANLQQDLANIRQFEAAHAGRVVVEAFEVRLPAALLHDECTAEMVTLLGAARESFAAAGLAHVPMACEAPLPTDADASLAHTTLRIALDGLSFHNFRATAERPGRPADRVLFKLRCGGVQAAAFPPVAQVAFAIVQAGERGVPMKFTAGLHHPVRRFDASVQCQMHGFLNVFGAALLRQIHELDERQVRAILEEETPTAFQFSDDVFSWCDLAAGAEDIVEARRVAATSFGSCSFDEPRDDLRAIGLLAHGIEP